MDLAPGEAREGDRVAIVYRCSTPALIRGIGGFEASCAWWGNAMFMG